MYVKPHLKATELVAKSQSRKLRRKAVRCAEKHKGSGKHIRVELVSAADVQRLEGRDDALQASLDQRCTAIESRLEALHRQLYEVMEALARLRDRSKK